ncbi:hypothetical protein PENSPDRAFT_657042 [Peniophora sp. CONT]|nr:hypothetical protein PENSPDRAFT_657042 [Peniophora sp. CONT]
MRLDLTHGRNDNKNRHMHQTARPRPDLRSPTRNPLTILQTRSNIHPLPPSHIYSPSPATTGPSSPSCPSTLTPALAICACVNAARNAAFSTRS